MWSNNRTAIFGVKLNTHIPFVRIELNYFNQIRFSIHSTANHSSSFELFNKRIDEVLTVTMSFADSFCSINFVLF